MNIRGKPTTRSPYIHTYAELQQQIHRDLRVQHPEWVQPNGESPMCDSYEARLLELLDTLARQDPGKSTAPARGLLANSPGFMESRLAVGVR